MYIHVHTRFHPLIGGTYRGNTGLSFILKMSPGIQGGPERMQRLDIYIYIYIYSSVASFLVLGGGGQDPEMYRQKIYVLILRERAKRASASETYIFRTQIHLHT